MTSDLPAGRLIGGPWESRTPYLHIANVALWPVELTAQYLLGRCSLSRHGGVPAERRPPKKSGNRNLFFRSAKEHPHPLNGNIIAGTR